MVSSSRSHFHVWIYQTTQLFTIHRLEEQKKQAKELWNQLNTLSSKDPEKYREKIKETIEEANAPESHIKIQHCFTLRLPVVAKQDEKPSPSTKGSKCYINVLQCSRIYPMKEGEMDVPMLLSRERVSQGTSTTYLNYTFICELL
jgi:predicted adenine nucleotide alpha hydrolase (AANH) superfamily ATPase